MNVFGSSQAGETKKNISNLEQSIKSFSSKLDKFEHLLEENYKSTQIQEEQVEAIQLTCIQITEHMTRGGVSLQSIKEKYGDVEYEEVGKILDLLKFRCIYVKGEQKKQVLMEYIPHVVLINIEDLGCSRLDQICDDETLPCCIFHMEFNPKRC
ncbi:hypothetical protein QTP88_015565 [Uroleucon formosanum]